MKNETLPLIGQPFPSCDCGQPGQWRGDRSGHRVFSCAECFAHLKWGPNAVLTDLEKSMLAAGWVRSPNEFERWYASHAGKLQPAYPLELRVTDEVWLVARLYGQADRGGDKFARLMRFDTVARLESYLERHGVKAEAAAPFSNSWD